MSSDEPGRITVIAGTNGAGKSSVVGAALRARGVEYFNPDEATRFLQSRNPHMSLGRAQSQAWHRGKDGLERAVEQNHSFHLETTLGGNTIPSLIGQAADEGLHVRMFYIGLDSPELHIQRVQARVERGGHDIPEEKIRERYTRSRFNLIRLLPKLHELNVWDNSEEGGPDSDEPWKPLLILRMRERRILKACEPKKVPVWARPIFARAVELDQAVR